MKLNSFLCFLDSSSSGTEKHVNKYVIMLLSNVCQNTEGGESHSSQRR